MKPSSSLSGCWAPPFATCTRKPVLLRQMIQDAIAAAPFLTTSNLADAVEQIKFTPMALSLEELSKLWSVFFQAPYALSVAYHGHGRPDRKRGKRARPRCRCCAGVRTTAASTRSSVRSRPREHSCRRAGGCRRGARARRRYPSRSWARCSRSPGSNLGGDIVSVRSTIRDCRSPTPSSFPPRSAGNRADVSRWSTMSPAQTDVGARPLHRVGRRAAWRRRAHHQSAAAVVCGARDRHRAAQPGRARRQQRRRR